MTTAIILEDEPLLATQLRDKLMALWPDLEIVGMPTNGNQALFMAETMQPDIAFLDIRVPGMSGLDVARGLPDHIRVVFVTAYDDFAVEAFRTAAVDYLLKPVSDRQLGTTIKRLRSDNTQSRNQVLALLQEIGTNATPSFLQWIRAGIGATTVLVPVNDVIYFRSDTKYTSVITHGREHLLRSGIGTLEAQLDPDHFWRIHRGIIVRVDQIVSARRDLRGRYVISLRDRPESLRSSQTYGHLFKHM